LTFSPEPDHETRDRRADENALGGPAENRSCGDQQDVEFGFSSDLVSDLGGEDRAKWPRPVPPRLHSTVTAYPIAPATAAE
jgi:hypothetical protein